jgi:glycosyltransferase involved in cell wall biosynthesis
MRIVHIDRQRSWTGQTTRTYLVARIAKDRGHDVALVVHPGSELERAGREEGLEVLSTPMRGMGWYRSLPRIVRFLRKKSVDILHCHAPKDHTTGALAAPLASVGALVRTKHNHTRLRSKHLSLLPYRRSAAVITVSDFVRRLLIEDGVSGGKVETIHDSVDLEQFRPRPKNERVLKSLGLTPEDLIVGNVSSLHERKGIEETLRGLHCLRESRPDLPFRCVFVGKHRQLWEPLTRELGLEENVVFVGRQSDVTDYLSVFDVYILLSRQEALGTSILEAMCMELPVVVTDVGGIPEAVTPGTGVVLTETAPGVVANALADLLLDPKKRRELGVAARERVVRDFSRDAMLDRIMAVYDRVSTVEEN